MWKLVVAVALALAVGVGVAAARPDHRPSSSRALTVVIKNRDYHVIDVGAAGESVGDLRVGSAELWSRDESRAIGSFHILCTLTKRAADEGITQCNYTFSLPEGEITTQGVQTRASLSAVQDADSEAITGGTGRYAGARGEARLLASQPDKRVVVLRLLK